MPDLSDYIATFFANRILADFDKVLPAKMCHMSVMCFALRMDPQETHGYSPGEASVDFLA